MHKEFRCLLGTGEASLVGQLLHLEVSGSEFEFIIGRTFTGVESGPVGDSVPVPSVQVMQRATLAFASSIQVLVFEICDLQAIL